MIWIKREDYDANGNPQDGEGWDAEEGVPQDGDADAMEAWLQETIRIDRENTLTASRLIDPCTCQCHQPPQSWVECDDCESHHKRKPLGRSVYTLEDGEKTLATLAEVDWDQEAEVA